MHYTVVSCYLGQALVAASEHGICAIELGDDAETLKAGLRARFPQAELGANDPAFAAQVAQVVSLLETPGRSLALPLDVQGSAFQQRVWAALRDIPAGSTVSYAELAARIGSPQAIRAVAGACAANRLAVAIPCHRVIRSNGDLSGYRWGLARKRALLAREAADSSDEPL
jgi:AraC family transcriptional regulator, regulatory protein of adaptative response / methylated-DNA-[protein]-cysteine methyltransferase